MGRINDFKDDLIWIMRDGKPRSLNTIRKELLEIGAVTEDDLDRKLRNFLYYRVRNGVFGHNALGQFYMSPDGTFVLGGGTGLAAAKSLRDLADLLNEIADTYEKYPEDVYAELNRIGIAADLEAVRAQAALLCHAMQAVSTQITTDGEANDE